MDGWVWMDRWMNDGVGWVEGKNERWMDIDGVDGWMSMDV